MREAYTAYPSYASTKNLSSNRVFTSKKTARAAANTHTATAPRDTATPRHNTRIEEYIGCRTHRYTPRALRPAPLG